MERRLDRLTKVLGVNEPPRGQIAFVDLPNWPPEACEAFLAAEDAGDYDTVAELVEAQTGVRPTPGGRYVSLVVDLPIDVVGEELAELKPRYVSKETGR